MRNPNKSAESSCDLGNGVQHVINVVFDNTHFTRDNPNVPSDLEQMPALLNFLKGNGTLLTNEHTPLIAHTATDILTALTGTYGDNMGVPIANSFRYYLPNGNSSTGVSFAYWTAPLFDPTGAAGTDLTTNMLTAQGKNAPAPVGSVHPRRMQRRRRGHREHRAREHLDRHPDRLRRRLAQAAEAAASAGGK